MTTSNDVGFHPLALLAACAFPGAGHMARGERARGGVLMAGVLGLFVGGMLVGGVDVIDSKEDRPWFYAQSLVGPLAFGVDYYHQHYLKVIDPTTTRRRSAFPGEGRHPRTGEAVKGGTPPKTMSIGRVNELGMLCAGLAGMLNLIVVIDAGFPTRRKAPAVRQVGLKTTLADAEAGIRTPTTVDDPLKGGPPGATLSGGKA